MKYNNVGIIDFILFFSSFLLLEPIARSTHVYKAKAPESTAEFR